MTEPIKQTKAEAVRTSNTADLAATIITCSVSFNALISKVFRNFSGFKHPTAANMAPKATSGDKKPAQPAKKAVAKKSTAGRKKGGSKKAVESYKIYIYKVYYTLKRS